MKGLSSLEFAAKTAGAVCVFFGGMLIIYAVFFLYKSLPLSKYQMATEVVFGLILCYVGYTSLCFRQLETGHMVYEHDIVE